MVHIPVQQQNFGNTELRISPIIVDCETLGFQEWWYSRKYALKVLPILKSCYDKALRTFDIHEQGEALLTEFLEEYQIKRETIVIVKGIDFFLGASDALEVFGPEERELSKTQGYWREHILSNVAESVKHFGYIDVMQVPHLGPELPLEEIMCALNEVVENGHVRYLSASSMPVSQLVQLEEISERHNWAKIVGLELFYNLLHREDEHELIPYAREHGMALMSFAPLASGVLARSLGDGTKRTHPGSYLAAEVGQLWPKQQAAVSRLQELAASKHRPMAAVAVAWVRSKGCVPIVGFSSMEHVDDALDALHTTLSPAEIEHLELFYCRGGLYGK
ncbi:related to Putative aryl-alcohol dehydrogenase YPL088W [Zygosaccharomyces bailii]|nr:related to Putative aryl-alcohol dehydrogenase YPL088W [Zygosaccharomyces bailii]